nr:CbiQ family ECF transporter T component [Leucobacter weissii]
MRPGAKLIGLFAFAAAVVAVHGVASTAIALLLALALTALAGLRGRELWISTRGFVFVAIPLFAFQWWQRGWQHGFEVVGDLLAMILAASAVTASTAAADMLDTISWALRPFRRLGVDPERVALAFSLVIRSIPSILGIARETRTAARARGLERAPRALLIPFVLRTVAHAQLVGQALAARGVGEE